MDQDLPQFADEGGCEVALVLGTPPREEDGIVLVDACWSRELSASCSSGTMP